MGYFREKFSFLGGYVVIIGWVMEAYGLGMVASTKRLVVKEEADGGLANTRPNQQASSTYTGRLRLRKLRIMPLCATADEKPHVRCDKRVPIYQAAKKNIKENTDQPSKAYA